MKIREIHCDNWLLRKHISAITLYPFIFYNKASQKYNKSFSTLRHHEMIHIAQVQSIGWFKFYSKYIISAEFRTMVEKAAYEGQYVY